MGRMSRHEIVLPSGLQIGLASAVDTFTDVDGTTLADHLPDGGGRWIMHPRVLIANGTGVPVIDNNRVHSEAASTGTRIAYHSAIPESPDYDVAADVVMRSDNNLSAGGVLARLSPVELAYYMAFYQTNGNKWTLHVQTPTTFSQTDVAAVLVVDQVYRLRLSCIGAIIKMFVDDVEIAAITDASIWLPGHAGMRLSSSSTSTTGVHLDNWQATPNNP